MNSVGLVHVIAAVVALTSGAVVLLNRKGTRFHRVLGRLYFGSMIALNVTALLIYRLFDGFGPFHAAALVSLCTVIPGFLVARRQEPGWLERHFFWMTFSYVGLVAAAAAEIGTRLTSAPFWWAVALPSLLIIGVGAWLIFRRAKHTMAPFRTIDQPVRDP